MSVNAWDGSNGEHGLIMGLSTWHYVFIEAPTPMRVYVYAILAVLVVLIALFFLVWKRMGVAPVVMGGALPVTTASFETMEPLGGDQIQWDDDSF